MRDDPGDHGAPAKARELTRPQTVLCLALLALLCACDLRSKRTPTDAGGPMDAAYLSSAPMDAGPDPAVVAREAAFKKANLWLAGLKFLVAINKSNAKEVEGEGDAESICDAVKSTREKATDVQVAAKLDESLALCAFDIPLIYANEALEHLKTASSQASVRLMCERSGQEIAKAKAVNRADPRVRAAEARRASRCR